MTPSLRGFAWCKGCHPEAQRQTLTTVATTHSSTQRTGEHKGVCLWGRTGRPTQCLRLGVAGPGAHPADDAQTATRSWAVRSPAGLRRPSQAAQVGAPARTRLMKQPVELQQRIYPVQHPTNISRKCHQARKEGLQPKGGSCKAVTSPNSTVRRDTSDPRISLSTRKTVPRITQGHEVKRRFSRLRRRQNYNKSKHTRPAQVSATGTLMPSHRFHY